MCSDVLYEDFEYLYTMNVDWQKLNNKTVFKNFHIDFYKNQINCIVGKSGCGKRIKLYL